MEKIYEVTCDFKVSPKCKKTFTVSRRAYQTTMKNNNGKYICKYCSLLLKQSGRNNPNAKYYFDDNYFSKIDTEEKAYLLGWIASDGTIRKTEFAIEIHKKDIAILETLRSFINIAIPITYRENNVLWRVYSKQIAQDLCKWLKINSGKKSDVVQFPDLDTDELKWHFLRGYFDGDGSTRRPDRDRLPEAKISSTSEKMKNDIKEFTKIPCRIYGLDITWEGTNALDFLGKLYEKANYKLERKHERYLEWCFWIPALRSGKKIRGRALDFRWAKSDPDAIPPSKSRISDSGYDLTLIKKVKTIGMVDFYDTGIKVKPHFGWYFMIVPRSSISKSGYMLANSVGIIDRTYIGSILVPLIKIDPAAKDLELPIKMVQMIPMPIIAPQIKELNKEEWESLIETERGEEGFGSTGK